MFGPKCPSCESRNWTNWLVNRGFVCITCAYQVPWIYMTALCAKEAKEIAK